MLINELIFCWFMWSSCQRNVTTDVILIFFLLVSSATHFAMLLIFLTVQIKICIVYRLTKILILQKYYNVFGKLKTLTNCYELRQNYNLFYLINIFKFSSQVHKTKMFSYDFVSTSGNLFEFDTFQNYIQLGLLNILFTYQRCINIIIWK